MTLSFSLQLNGKPTYFPEKVICGLYAHHVFGMDDFNKYFNPFLKSEYRKKKGKSTPKLHTIRADKANRWKAGNKIHFVINNRTKNRMQFAPVVECKSVQGIHIDPELRVILFDHYVFGLQSFRSIGNDDIERLAINDGFESVEDFWAYFDKPFEGKIIHWTDLTY